MRFALLGNHPDGAALAAALVSTGRHQLAAVTAPRADDILRQSGAEPRQVADLEEILANPAVEAVVVAGHPAVRPTQLRRALQSERHVLCVHPVDDTPDIAYEAAMLQADGSCILLPLLPEALHPALTRLANFL